MENVSIVADGTKVVITILDVKAIGRPSNSGPNKKGITSTVIATSGGFQPCLVDGGKSVIKVSLNAIR